MTSLVALFGGYLLAILIGKHARKIGPARIFLLGVITLVEVLIVVVNMFLMEVPAAGKPG